MQTLQEARDMGYSKDEDVEFCPKCGHEIVVSRESSERCGKISTHTEKYCRHCGYYEGP